MLNLPGDLVRRAAANVSSTVNSTVNTVSSTVSSVASVASGKRRASEYENNFEDQVLANAKEKYNFTVKCTPNKDAATTASLSIKSGFMMKRNEQGVWHKKFLCSVPHLFLYYFDSDTAESPRGVIDMELYSNIAFEDNVLKLSTSDEELLRTFYFQDDDKDNLNNWSSSLIRDRYHNVCDERDAYQQMQLEMTGAMDYASVQRKSSEVERSALESELAQANRTHTEAMAILRGMLVIVGVTEEDMHRLSTDVHKIGHALKTSILDLKAGLERKADAMAEAVKEQARTHSAATETLQAQMEADREAFRHLEQLLTSERCDSESRLQEAACEAENAMLNLQMAVAEKSALETRNATLGEQKKILVKEVKALRRRLEESGETVEQLKGLNDRLSTATGLLQKQLHALGGDTQRRRPSSDTVEADGFQHKAEPDGTSSSDAVGPSLDELLLQNDRAVNHIRKSITLGQQQQQQQQQLGIDSPAAVSHEGGESASGERGRTGSASSQGGVHFSSMASRLFSSADSNNSATQEAAVGDSDQLSQGAGGSRRQSEDGEERVSWEMPPTTLRELGWLSPEQDQLIGNRLSDAATNIHRNPAEAPVTSTPPSQAHRSSSLSMLSGAMTSLMGGANSVEGSPPVSRPQEAPSVQSSAGRRSSMGMLASMFGSRDPARVAGPLTSSGGGALLSEDLQDQTDLDGGATGSEASKHNSFFQSPFANSEEDDPERLPTAMRLRCLRCEGSVEGPKYSTCRCSVPALCPEDLLAGADSGGGAGGMRLFSGMISKGSSVAGGIAGGIAGGLMKASTAMAYSSSVTPTKPEGALNAEADIIAISGANAAVQHQFNDD